MFEKYGIGDFFNSIIKNLAKILIIMLIFAILGAVYTINDSRIKTIEKKNVHYSEISSVYVQIPQKPIYEGEQNYFTFSSNLINAYVSLLNTEPARQYIYGKMLEKYTQAELDSCTMEIVEDAKNKNIYQHMVVSTVGTAPVINITSTTTNQQLSKDMVRYAVQYLQEEAFPSLNLGSINKVEPKSYKFETLSENEYIVTDLAGNLSIKQFIINVVLFSAFGAAFAAIIIFIYALFHPTINRKKDFENYGVSVLGEVKNRKGE